MALFIQSNQWILPTFSDAVILTTIRGVKKSSQVGAHRISFTTRWGCLTLIGHYIYIYTYTTYIYIYECNNIYIYMYVYNKNT